MGRLPSVELHHLMTLPRLEVGEITVGRISNDKHPQTCRLAPLRGCKESWTLGHRQEPGRSGDGHHTDGIDTRRRDNPCLFRIPQSTDLQMGFSGDFALLCEEGIRHCRTTAVGDLSKIK
jgi:hypothetical protein